VTCDYNLEHSEGFDRNIIQNELLKNENIVETVFRPSKGNYYVKKKIIKIDKVKFLSGNVLASVRDTDTYFGMCNNCPDMCGIQK
jgi:hypothetical protein